METISLTPKWSQIIDIISKMAFEENPGKNDASIEIIELAEKIDSIKGCPSLTYKEVVEAIIQIRGETTQGITLYRSLMRKLADEADKINEKAE